tara:strand:+ start:183 stop:818 length:636 start_codon:yes stop_codon:yes gene_type:complete
MKSRANKFIYPLQSEQTQIKLLVCVMKKEVLMYKFTFKNGDELELKGFKHAQFASQETHCFEASVYFNGKKIGVVSNEGHGGCDDFTPSGGIDMWKSTNTLWERLSEKLEEEHPKYYCDFLKKETTRSMEGWVCTQVNNWLAHRDFKKYMKSKVVFTDPTSDDPKAIRYLSFKGVRSITKAHIDHIIAKYPKYNVLNVMPQEEALALWMAH